jgi:hypothetical protein
MAISAPDLLRHVIAPVLESCPVTGIDTPSARVLLLATACHESACGTYLVQRKGPARGIYQMEPATHDDVYRRAPIPLRAWILSYCCGLSRDATPALLAGNLLYATVMARVGYWLAPEPLPAARDLAGIARYWRQYWCRGCAGTEAEFQAHWDKYAGDLAWELSGSA